MFVWWRISSKNQKKENKRILGKIKDKKPIPIGQVVYVETEKLSSDYLIHAPTVKEPGGDSSFSKVTKAINACLDVSNKLNLDSLAIPLLGSGAGDLSKKNL
ncbi:hypothetical protein C9439_06495 [archaeon SCG-AAA382B04]|nr:hypothetical protein C9439_06495 [archaeon SCG-AAA382B04]